MPSIRERVYFAKRTSSQDAPETSREPPQGFIVGLFYWIQKPPILADYSKETQHLEQVARFIPLALVNFRPEVQVVVRSSPPKP